MMPLSQTEKQQIIGKTHAVLATIYDPEIPVISVKDLGIIHKIDVGDDGHITIGITPTYSGCPAISVIEDSVQQALAQAGFSCKTERLLNPAWSSDFITQQGHQKLHDYGIAPPTKNAVACVRCGSEDVRLISQFGSTACKALYACETCREPFDYFKCL